MSEPKYFSSAYPGSMSQNENGGYVEREDSESLAGALLKNLYAVQREMEDWRTSAIDLEKQLAERDAALARCVEAIKALLIMNDCGPSPRKLDDALTWRQNDEKARSLAIAAISGLPDSAKATAKDTDAR